MNFYSALPMKKTIIIITFICTVALFALLGWFVLSYRSAAACLARAQAAMRNGDLKAAEAAFLEVIRRDRANETAYRALAEIAEKNHKPVWAADYWGIAAKLNPLSKGLRAKYVAALLATAQYSAIAELLGGLDIEELSQPELYALARACHARNRPDETRPLAAVLLKQAPDDPKILLLYAEVQLSDRKTESANRFFARLADCPDENIRINALLGLGRTWLLLGKPDRAAACYEKAAAVSTASPGALMILADYNLNHGKAPAAKRQYQQLHKRFPKNLIITLRLAEIYALDKDAAAIKTLLNHLPADSRAEVAGKYYLQALLAYLENNPAKLKQNLQLCRQFRNRPLYAYLQFPEILLSNDVPRIEHYVAKLLKINASPAARADLCRQLERLALQDFQQKKYDTAAGLARIMLNLRPDDPAPLHLAMVCAYHRQKWYEAVTAADKFNARCPHTLDYLSIKGRSLLYLGETGKALPLLHQLTVLTPDRPETWLWAAQAAYLAGNLKKAEAYLDQVLHRAGGSHSLLGQATTFFIDEGNMKLAAKIARHLESSPDKILRAIARRIKARETLDAGHWQEAINYLRQAAELDGNGDTLLYISDIYLEHRQPKPALEYAERVLKTAPDSVKAQFRRAVILQQLGKYEPAAEIYRKLLEKYPGWALALVNLSEIMAAKGANREALELARRARKTAPLWPRAGLCLALRELDCGNYTAALRLLEALPAPDTGSATVRNALARCLAAIIKKHITDGSFELAKLRLKQLQTIVPGGGETAVLQQLLAAAKKAADNRKPE
ncbi:MAG: tetratricopeptide repeat protein [Victivallaceae bacterium]|nr:tetratricopeptide repeat protein [Victivallaceae bacterium]